MKIATSASLAQTVERVAVNLDVLGSNPRGSDLILYFVIKLNTY